MKLYKHEYDERFIGAKDDSDARHADETAPVASLGKPKLAV